MNTIITLQAHPCQCVQGFLTKTKEFLQMGVYFLKSEFLSLNKYDGKQMVGLILSLPNKNANVDYFTIRWDGNTYDGNELISTSHVASSVQGTAKKKY